MMYLRLSIEGIPAIFTILATMFHVANLTMAAYVIINDVNLIADTLNDGLSSTKPHLSKKTKAVSRQIKTSEFEISSGKLFGIKQSGNRISKIPLVMHSIEKKEVGSEKEPSKTHGRYDEKRKFLSPLVVNVNYKQQSEKQMVKKEKADRDIPLMFYTFGHKGKTSDAAIPLQRLNEVANGKKVRYRMPLNGFVTKTGTISSLAKLQLTPLPLHSLGSTQKDEDRKGEVTPYRVSSDGEFNVRSNGRIPLSIFKSGKRNQATGNEDISEEYNSGSFSPVKRGKYRVQKKREMKQATYASRKRINEDENAKVLSNLIQQQNQFNAIDGFQMSMPLITRSKRWKNRQVFSKTDGNESKPKSAVKIYQPDSEVLPKHTRSLISNDKLGHIGSLDDYKDKIHLLKRKIKKNHFNLRSLKNLKTHEEKSRTEEHVEDFVDQSLSILPSKKWIILPLLKKGIFHDYSKIHGAEQNSYFIDKSGSNEERKSSRLVKMH